MKKNIDPMKEFKSCKLALWTIFTGTAVTAVLSLIGTFVLFSKHDAGAVEAAEWFVRTFAAAAFSLGLLIFCRRYEKEKKVFTAKNLKLLDFISVIAVVGALLSWMPHLIGNTLNIERTYTMSPFIFAAIAGLAEFIKSIFKCDLEMQNDTIA